METVLQILMAFIGGFGFSMVFGAGKKYWLLISINAMLSWSVYLLVNHVGGNFVANLISAAFCSLYAHLAARAVKAPVTCLLMPATVPMIPGGSLYYTMYYGLRGNRISFVQYAYQTAGSIFGMAIGFALISLLFRTYTRSRAEKLRD